MRIAIALLLAPLLAAAMYLVAYFVFSLFAPVLIGDATMFVVALLPYTYLGALMVLLPSTWIFVKLQKSTLSTYMSFGGGLGVVLAFIAVEIPPGNEFSIEVALYFLFCMSYGIAFGLCFWLMAFATFGNNAQKRRKNERV
jgi:hypothetical protein